VRTSAPAIVMTAVVLASLTACAPTDGACEPLIPTGTQPSYVEAEGAVLSAPDVSFPTPLLSRGAEQSVIVAGDGEPIEAGQPVDFQASLYDGESGEFITASEYDPESPPLRRTAGSGADVLSEVLKCASVGSRIAATVTVADVFGSRQLDPQLGLDDGDPLVLILDVQAAYLAKADGAPQLGASGVPAVVTTPEGLPGITVPDKPAPEDLIDHVLLRGDGQAITQGDRAVLHYLGVVWETGSVFDSSWERGLPSSFTIASFDDDPLGIVPGLAEALVGKTVGSQVVVVIPPRLGYPLGESPASIPPGTTMIFVVDILGIEG
jgi:hypothetical protein